jgi:hypothetical protein
VGMQLVLPQRPALRLRPLPRFLRGGRLEVAAIVGLYLVSELSRGIARGGAEVAQKHAASVVRLERGAHVFGEPAVQRAAHHVPALPALLGYAYVTLHLVVTAAVLMWVYRVHRRHYASLRNTLFAANALAVVGYWLYPTAPPRLAGVGIGDTVSGATSINLTSRFVSTFYNEYAAVPSMHIGFSVICGAAIVILARSRTMRVVGTLYPVFVLFVIVATGNHFFFDALAGALVAAVAVAALRLRSLELPRLLQGSPSR